MSADPRHQKGALAEQVAADYLRQAGFAILDRNLRMGRLEIDIVAQEDDVIAIVEVRTRGPGSWQRALDSVGTAKQRKLRAAGARLWARQLSTRDGVRRLRFDVIAVDLEPDGAPSIEHIRAAF